MLDITPIKQYLEEPTTFIESFVKNEIEHIGLDEYITDCLERLDCTRETVNGFRPMQTIGYPYMRELTELFYAIDNFIDTEENKDVIIAKVLKQHQLNLEFEAINPPVWYGGEKAKRKFEKTYRKDTSSKPKEHKPKGPTAAEKRLAAKVAKINSLSIKIKPV